MQNQVGQDTLLLLPPGLAIMESKAVQVFAGRPVTLHHVIPTAALLIAAD